MQGQRRRLKMSRFQITHVPAHSDRFQGGHTLHWSGYFISYSMIQSYTTDKIMRISRLVIHLDLINKFLPQNIGRRSHTNTHGRLSRSDLCVHSLQGPVCGHISWERVPLTT